MSAALAHLVERHLAKVEVASSSLVGRSISKPPRLLRGGFSLPWRKSGPADKQALFPLYV